MQMNLQVLTMKTLPKFFDQAKEIIMEGHHTSYYLFYQILLRRLWKNMNMEVHLNHLPHILSQSFLLYSLILRGNITSHSLNPPPLLFGDAIAVIEPKDKTFLPDPNNIGV